MSGGGYEIEDLERMVVECDRNIVELQKGIDREEANKAHFQHIIDDLRQRAAQDEIIDEVNNRTLALLKDRLDESDGSKVVEVRSEEIQSDGAN
jgi:uncharacterized coiled-coil protein SlyX